MSALAIAPASVLLIASAFVILVSSHRLRDDRDLVLHTYEVIDAAQSLLSSVQDAETGQRGYIITRREDYLDPYREATSRIPQLLARLRELTDDNPSQQPRIEALTKAADRMLAEFAAVIDTLRRSGDEAARALIMTDAGREAMEDIRRNINDIDAVEEALLRTRIAAAEETQSDTLMVATGSMIAALLALAIAQFLLTRRNAQLRRAEADAALKAALLQATLDHTREGIVAFDAAGRVQAFNRRFFEQVDLPPLLAAEGTSLDGILAADAARTPAALHRVRPQAGPPAAGDEGVFQGRIGRRVVEIEAHPTGDGGFLLSSVDVTRRVRAEEMAAQSQKMEAIGQLTGGVAHDFNNLLQIVRGNLDLLAGEIADNPRAKQRLDAASAATERGARLTRQLLAFARRQPLEPRVVNLGRMVTEMSDLLRRSLGERIEIETVIGGGLWSTLADPAQIENALLNLGLNARDAMPDGGKLTIELANTALDDAYASRHAEVLPGQYVMLAVTDTGVGMPPDVMARVFEPFFTTKPEGRGTGLGLPQVYGFVRQSGGHIKLYSEPGHGTTVKIYLPRATRAPEWEKPEMPGPVTGGTETVLVVEDDAEVRRGAVDVLGSLGYRVLQAATIEYGLDILENAGRIDLLFTDVVMPGPLKPTELARRAKELQPSIAVLFTSGYTENAIIHNGRLDPGVHLISKPYRREDLARKLRTLLGGPLPAPAAGEAAAPVDPAALPAPPVLPAAARLRDAASAPPAARADRGTSALRVLVVEDEPIVRMSTIDMLAELGHRAEEAASGREALQILAADTGLDLLLTDIGLPDMSGEDLAAQSLVLRPGLPVIFATGYQSRPEGVGPSVAAAFLGKPFTMDELRGAIDDAMHASAPITPG